MGSDTIVARKGTTYYYVLTEEQVRALEEYDTRTGDTLDSAGEPRLYSQVTSGCFQTDTPVAITKRRNVQWPTWRNKPKYLCEGVATIDGVPRVIMVVDRSGAK